MMQASQRHLCQSFLRPDLQISVGRGEQTSPTNHNEHATEKLEHDVVCDNIKMFSINTSTIKI